MRIAACFLIVCSVCGSEAQRLRADTPRGTVIHGTACVVDGLVITASHVVEGETARIEVDARWVNCTVQRRDTGKDIVLLKPDEPLPDSCASGSGIWAAIGQPADKEHPPQQLPVRRLEFGWNKSRLTCAGYASGGSGAPIYIDGRLFGISVAAERDPDRPEEATVVVYIPVAAICRK